MKQTVLPPLLLLALLCGASATAQETMMFEDIDSNHNGAISMQEAEANMDISDNFASVDSNGDGTISVDEYTAYENRGRLVPEEVEVPGARSGPGDALAGTAAQHEQIDGMAVAAAKTG